MIYLDNAATTFPKPSAVTDEVIRCIKTYCGNPGRGSHFMARRAAEVIYEAREALSSLVGHKNPEGCVFTLNTTYALNIAIKSLVAKGDHILISDMEHNSVLRQVVRLKLDGIADYDMFCTSGGDDRVIRDIKRKIKPNTRLLVCLLSSNICSLSLPAEKIGKLCRENGIMFIADAAQSAGHDVIDMERMNIGALCVPSHKGLYGPQGAGAVIFGELPEGIIKTFVEGGSGSDSKNPLMPAYLPDRLEGGTLPTPAIAGLLRGIEFVQKTGIESIKAHEASLSRYLASELACDRSFKVYGRADGGIVLFNVKGKPSTDVASTLDREYSICVRPGFHCAPIAHKTLGTGDSGAVRVSFGVMNTEKDIKALINALWKIRKSI